MTEEEDAEEILFYSICVGNKEFNNFFCNSDREVPI